MPLSVACSLACIDAAINFAVLQALKTQVSTFTHCTSTRMEVDSTDEWWCIERWFSSGATDGCCGTIGLEGLCRADATCAPSSTAAMSLQ